MQKPLKSLGKSFIHDAKYLVVGRGYRIENEARILFFCCIESSGTFHFIAHLKGNNSNGVWLSPEYLRSYGIEEVTC